MRCSGYFVITFVYYWWHRARHEIPFLWQWLHQIHHSACSIEVLTSFYKHPVEISSTASSRPRSSISLLGLDAASASLAVLLAGIAELFYHWNVRTPRWLGIPHPAPGKPLHPSSARLAPQQLLRPSALGHPVRDLREPAHATHALRLRTRRRAAVGAHAARQERAEDPHRAA